MSLAQRQRIYFAILIVIIVGVGAVAATIWFRYGRQFFGPSEFMKGVSYTTWSARAYASAESDSTLSQVIKPMGVTWVSIIVTCYQEKASSRDINCGTNNTPTDESLKHAIQYARRQGLRVMLKPHIDLSNDKTHWRGDIEFGTDDAAWRVWFENYTRMIVRYAQIAQDNGVEYFVIGTELQGTSQRVDQWRAVIKAVRAVYKGSLTYAANVEEEHVISWWDALDAIGIDAYYSLTPGNDPSLADLKAAWSPIADDLEQLSQKWNRPIIFTEIGYRSVNGANKNPWDSGMSGTVDLQEQADCYRAVFEVLKDKSWWRGAFWWNWEPNPSAGGARDVDYTANNKPAEDVLRFYYGAAARNK
ncbi:MAG: hypothetical protein HZC38_03110 [Chloroflexi bacterium]|nr:hypothetical protein [Chloroflexota bacterium]MBI5712407.1 hypothetical protein [Chloroflexota bacterium]